MQKELIDSGGGQRVCNQGTPCDPICFLTLADVECVVYGYSNYNPRVILSTLGRHIDTHTHTATHTDTRD